MALHKHGKGSQAASAAENVTYRIQENMLIVEGTGEIPDCKMHRGSPWFSERGRLTSLRISEGITKVGKYAFYGCAFRDVTLPEGLTKIAPYAFSGCSDLRRVLFPRGLRVIGNAAFACCNSLRSVIFSPGKLKIGDRAFCACSALEEVVFSEGLSQLGEGSFEGCGALKQLCYTGTAEAFDAVEKERGWCGATPPALIPAFKPKPQRSAAAYAPFSYTLSEDGTLHLHGQMPNYTAARETPWYAEREKILRVSADASTSVIGSFAFAELPRLTAAILPDAVHIGIGAFANCPSLCGAVLSPALTQLGSDAFAGCTRFVLLDLCGTEAQAEALLSMLPAAGLDPKRLVLRTLREASGAVLAASPADPAADALQWRLTEDGVLTVQGGAMPDYTHSINTPWYPYRERIRRVVVERGVYRIGTRAFADLPCLEEAVVCAVEVGDFAFVSSASLFTAELFGMVRRVGAFAFAGTGLKHAFPGVSVCRLPEGVYHTCHSLKTLLLPPALAEVSADVTDGCPSLSQVKALATRETFKHINGRPKWEGRILCLWDSNGGVVRDAYGSEEAVTEHGRRAMTATRERNEEAEQARMEAVEAFRRLATCIQEAKALQPFSGELRALDATAERFHSLEVRASEKAYPLSIPPKNPPARLLSAEEDKKIPREYKKKVKKMREQLGELTAALRRASKAERELAEVAEDFRAVVAKETAAAELLFPYGAAPLYAAEAMAEQAQGLHTVQEPRALYKRALSRLELVERLLETALYTEGEKALTELRELLIPSLGGLEAVEETSVEPTETKKPRIYLSYAHNKSDRLERLYREAVEAAGGIAVCRWNSREEPQTCDGLILMDGPDIAPLLYGERNRGSVGINTGRDTLERKLFDAFYLYGKPILGIGRGAQFINIRLEGSLCQDLPEGQKKMHLAAEASAPVHDLTLVPGGFLAAAYPDRRAALRTNSNHHQSISQLGRGLILDAVSTDGVIEGFRHTGLPIFGVQFLPEQMNAPATDPGAPLFESFVRKCAEPPLWPSAPAPSEAAKK